MNKRFGILTILIVFLFCNKGFSLSPLSGRESPEKIAKMIEMYKQALHTNPYDKFAYGYLGAAYSSLGRDEEAIKVYKQAISLDPDSDFAYFGLGATYYKLKRYPEAIEAFKQLIRIKPNLASAYDSIGMSYGKSERYQEAAKAFKQAISIKPDFAEAYGNLGITYGKLECYSEAVEAYKQAIRIKPDYVRAHQSLGENYVSLENFDLALEQYKILKNLDKDSASKLFDMLPAHTQAAFDGLEKKRMHERIYDKKYQYEKQKALAKILAFDEQAASIYRKDIYGRVGEYAAEKLYAQPDVFAFYKKWQPWRIKDDKVRRACYADIQAMNRLVKQEETSHLQKIDNLQEKVFILQWLTEGIKRGVVTSSAKIYDKLISHLHSHIKEVNILLSEYQKKSDTGEFAVTPKQKAEITALEIMKKKLEKQIDALTGNLESATKKSEEVKRKSIFAHIKNIRMFMWKPHSVFEKNGNVFIADKKGQTKQLTFSGKDSQPSLSSDKKAVVFVRAVPDRRVGIDIRLEEDVEANEIRTIDIKGKNPELIVKAGRIPPVGCRFLARLNSPQFSPDGKNVYFMTMSWGTSDAICRAAIDTKELCYIRPGNTLEVIKKGKYAGYLIIKDHRYLLGGGSYDWFRLLYPDGKECSVIGKTDKNFKDMYVK